MPEQLQLKGGQDTPLIRQYLHIKEKCKDAILLYRLGDFYEMFFDDAVVASKVLDIALTARDKQALHPIPLCGVPHHSAKAYISKLLDAGHKVAICEQVEDPATAKGIVRREIVKVITSGTRSDEEGLLSIQSNHVLSLFIVHETFTLAWIDVSNGAIEVASFSNSKDAKNFILTLSPSEIVISDDPKTKAATSFFSSDPFFQKYRIEYLVPWIFEQSQKEVLKKFHISHIDSLGIQDLPKVTEAIYGLIYYIEEKNLIKLPHVQIPKRYVPQDYAYLDYVTQENLEIFDSKRSLSKMSSLFSVLNQTVTGMGARELVSRMRKPLRSLDKIKERLNRVEHLKKESQIRNEIRKQLCKITDIERILRRIAIKNATIGDLISLRITLREVPTIRAMVESLPVHLFADMTTHLHLHADLCEMLEQAIGDVASVHISDGGFIRRGYHPELDQCRSLSSQNQEWLALLETQEKRRTGISSLKISYNRVFGYYIEITKVHHDKVPPDYIRKQTLVSAERYITPELKTKELEIQNAKEKMISLEFEILQSIREKVAFHVQTLQELSAALAQIDVDTGLAEVATLFNYVKPDMTSKFSIRIEKGRHPTVERNLSEPFIPNDLSLTPDSRMILLTGPNMAGKSTVMRQVAVIVLMAQIGSFVPADRAELSIVDRIFTRIGASDDLSGGRSTFMVEMNETAQILLNATDQSLILLDEIGRGTGTYDGLSIAWAVAEDIDQRIKAKTIFATHYHELTKLTETHPAIHTMRMAIREWNDQIVFLRKIEDGVTERSYGIEVAEIAGVPKNVIQSAKKILKELENPSHEKFKTQILPKEEPQPDLLANDLQQLNVDEFTPKQALDFLYDLKKRVTT